MSFLESVKDIQDQLDAFGETLTFINYTVKGILTFTTTELYEGAVKQQIFKVHVASSDVISKGISVDDEFTLSTRENMFSFQVNNNPIPYYDGWHMLEVILNEINNV